MKIVIDLDEKIYNNINWFIDIPRNDPSNIAMAIKNGVPLNKVIEDIKQEIQRTADGIHTDYFDIITDEGIRTGLEQACEIIDRHLKGENE